MTTPIILSRTPFRLSLGGGSTDLPSYYERYGGFVFTAAINLYMDIVIKEPRSDDLFHVHYKRFESVPTIAEIRHEIARQALLMQGSGRPVAISFKADTPAGTGLGSSGACAVGLLAGLAAYHDTSLLGESAAAAAYALTRSLGLPDGPQDPYACALGGFQAIEIARDGRLTITQPRLRTETVRSFFQNTLFFYTGVERESTPLLAAQGTENVIALKHRTKALGYQVLEALEQGDLETFGMLLDRHWEIKKAMGAGMSTPDFDAMYESARDAGALGGKIMGAGGGGYFMFYCPDAHALSAVRNALAPFKLREMHFSLDTQGVRTKRIVL